MIVLKIVQHRNNRYDGTMFLRCITFALRLLTTFTEA